MDTDLHRFKRLFFLLLPFIFYLLPCIAQTGNDAQWATAGKQAIGTSASLESKVWFTLANGVMTEVYYPDVTVANVHLLQFVVVNPKTKKVETELDDAAHQVKDYFSKYYEYKLTNKDKKKQVFTSSPYQYTNPDDIASLRYYQINTSKSGEWKITKDYVTDPKGNSVLINVQFDTKNKDLELYLYYDPSLRNSGMNDTGWSEEGALLVKDDTICSALISSKKLSEMSNDFFQIEEGLEQLKTKGKIFTPQAKAENGNVVQIAKVGSKGKNQGIFTVALGFGKTPNEALTTAQTSLKRGFVNPFNEYVKGWSDYVKTLPKVDPKYQAQFNMAAMILKAFEDKTNRGANIASLSIPWGGAANANEVGSSGYHAVWARDLYQVATAFMALGDKDAANRALDFLFKVQQKADGSFPQNSWIDGKPIGGSLQMDQVGFPLILAHELGRFDRETYQKHIKPAADFIVKNGPTTPQERWEEKGGYSPSTIAAEIAGLVCAAEIAKKNGDNESANRWLKTADDWQQNVEKWTVTTTGKHSKQPYYVRLTQNGKPDTGEKYEINGVFGMVDERDIVDAGFLELVRLGIKSPTDKIIQNSIKVVDQVIKVNTPNGEGFYRYNFDSYGEPDNGQRWNFDGKWTGKGRLWALLSGERGQYELAYAPFGSDTPVTEPKKNSMTLQAHLRMKAMSRLSTMAQFANDGLMIPEQVWDSPNVPKNVDRQFMPELKFGEGTGSATPLAWSMAQFIRLAVNVNAGRNLDTPKVVYERYVLEKQDKEKTFISDSSNICLDKLRRQTVSEILSQNPQLARCDDGSYFAAFSYKGNANLVQIAGDFTDWKPKQLRHEIRAEGVPSNSIIRQFIKFAPTARVEYKLIIDGKWITDPLNPNKVDNGVGGENSFFTMPDYKPTTWDKIEENNLNRNQFLVYPQSLETLEIDSKVYGEKRKIQVLGPMATEIRTTFYPVLYLQDGGDYINRANAVQIQRNLLKAGKLAPFITVFLDPKDRMKEYWANDDYAKFLAEEVVPYIDSKYNTIKSRDGRAVIGASLGGITAVHVGLKYPNVFGRIGGQSSSFWIDNERVVKDLEKLDGKTKFQFYFDDGTLEGVEDSRKVVDILKKKGFDVTYIEGEAGHNWTAWRDRLADAFISLWK